VTLTRIDKPDIAIRGTAFANLVAVDIDEQVFHGDRTGMQWDCSRDPVGPPVTREAW
jgi:hypothetical protein